MAGQFGTPGVYIKEITGPGVIAGVGTSTAGFIGPALKGSINDPTFITSFDDFLRKFAIESPDGALTPFITEPRHFYMAYAVRGFYENGGKLAYIVRIGTARRTTWDVLNQGGAVAFQLEALQEGIAGDLIGVEVGSANMASGVTVVTGSAGIDAVNNTRITVDDVTPFQPGDAVTHDGSARATINQISADDSELTLSNTLSGATAGDTLRIADLQQGQTSFRVSDAENLRRGSVIEISGDEPADLTTTNSEFATVDRVNNNIVTLTQGLTDDYSLDEGAANFDPATLTSQEFTVVVHPPDGSDDEVFENLSLSASHPNYIFSTLDSTWVSARPPSEPSVFGLPDRLVDTTIGNVPLAVNGEDDDPGTLGADHYQAGIDALRRVDDVNFIAIPDASSNPERVAIQQALITHCLELGDRFAILDSWPGVEPSGTGSILDQRATVESERGFAALYYPWLEEVDRTAPNGGRLLVPPSGHVAGVYARVDLQRGVHKAPANELLRGALGLERRLTNEEQDPLNRAGVNALRIFPGKARPVIWGGRTTVRTDVTDWLYVNVRRLLLFIEESIEEGLRGVVFEPNNLALWQRIKRTIAEFLTRVWRDGALLGETPAQAFFVKVDEENNPPATRALGEVHIAIGVAPVRPAEFVIVEIGLKEEGSEISES
jgi:phage tail sheath protein FI